MSAIARVLLGRGYPVSGSDRQANALTDALIHDGAQIYIGHAVENIRGAQIVLLSSAVHADNPEVIAARAAGILTANRREALGALTAGWDVIAVAGTHGKTTTTALIVHLLLETGHDPTYIVGGTMLNTGSNAAVGKSRLFVIEADEYDFMFLGLEPKIGIILNVEHDHPDLFSTLEEVKTVFSLFASRVQIDGTLIVCTQDENARQIGLERKTAGARVVFYAANASDPDRLANEVRAIGLTPGHEQKQAGMSEEDDFPARAWLESPHNHLNLSAAVTALERLGIAPDALRRAARSFKGVARRMEKLGVTESGLTIYSDYGHHPTAIKATLQGTRQRFSHSSEALKGALWAVWQPHTYSRTHLLAEAFAHSFSDADHILITDIYAAREKPRPGPSESDIAHWAQQAGHPDVRYIGDLQIAAETLRAEARSGDVVIIFSAGDAPKIAEMLLNDTSDAKDSHKL